MLKSVASSLNNRMLRGNVQNFRLFSSIAPVAMQPGSRVIAEDLNPERCDVKLASVDENAICLKWGDGHVSKFHFSWLFSNCSCPICKTGSGQKTHEFCPTQVSVFNVSQNGNVIDIHWNDGVNRSHSFSYDTNWLRKHCYSMNTLIQDDESRKAMNDPMLRDVPSVEFMDVLDSTHGVADWLYKLNKFGVCTLDNAPMEKGWVTKAATLVGKLSHNIYGDNFEVMAQPKPINIAYTDKALPPHMDMAYYESPPGIQMLHCIRFDKEVEGGESTFIDAHAVAEEFQIRHPNEFDLLTKVPATFQKDHFDRENPVQMFYQRPHISLNHFGSVISVFWSPPFEGPLQIDPCYVDGYYDAYRKFSALMDSSEMWEKYGAQFRMKPGQMVSFNNRRVLHGRNAFTAEAGVRHLEGCYLDIDMYLCKLHVLSNLLEIGQGTLGITNESRTGLGNFR